MRVQVQAPHTGRGGGGEKQGGSGEKYILTVCPCLLCSGEDPKIFSSPDPPLRKVRIWILTTAYR